MLAAIESRILSIQIAVYGHRKSLPKTSSASMGGLISVKLYSGSRRDRDGIGIQTVTDVSFSRADGFLRVDSVVSCWKLTIDRRIHQGFRLTLMRFASREAERVFENDLTNYFSLAQVTKSLTVLVWWVHGIRRSRHASRFLLLSLSHFSSLALEW